MDVMFETPEVSEEWGAQEHVGHEVLAAEEHTRNKTHEVKERVGHMRQESM